MKSVFLSVLALSLIACDSSTNPLAVVNDDPVVASNDIPVVSAPVETVAPVQPQIQPQPTPQPMEVVTVQTQVQPVRGECIDTPPFNDGYGWDGVGSCVTPIVQAPAPEVEPVTEIVEVVEQPPVIFNPATQAQISLDRLTWSHDQISDRSMTCAEYFFNQSTREFQETNSTSSGSRWQHFENGTGEKFVFFLNEPVEFAWGVDEFGDYKSNLSPLAAKWGEVVNHFDGRVIYRLWDTVNPESNYFECYFL